MDRLGPFLQTVFSKGFSAVEASIYHAFFGLFCIVFLAFILQAGMLIGCSLHSLVLVSWKLVTGTPHDTCSNPANSFGNVNATPLPKNKQEGFSKTSGSLLLYMMELKSDLFQNSTAGPGDKARRYLQGIPMRSVLLSLLFVLTSYSIGGSEVGSMSLWYTELAAVVIAIMVLALHWTCDMTKVLKSLVSRLPQTDFDFVKRLHESCKHSLDTLQGNAHWFAKSGRGIRKETLELAKRVIRTLQDAGPTRLSSHVLKLTYDACGAVLKAVVMPELWLSGWRPQYIWSLDASDKLIRGALPRTLLQSILITVLLIAVRAKDSPMSVDLAFANIYFWVTFRWTRGLLACIFGEPHAGRRICPKGPNWLRLAEVQKMAAVQDWTKRPAWVEEEDWDRLLKHDLPAKPDEVKNWEAGERARGYWVWVSQEYGDSMDDETV